MAIPTAIPGNTSLQLGAAYLGLATFGLGSSPRNLLFPTGRSRHLGVSRRGGHDPPRPGFLAGGRRPFYYFVCSARVAGGIVLIADPLGRVFYPGWAASRGLGRTAPNRSGSLGIKPWAGPRAPPLHPPRRIFCISAFFAGISGGAHGSAGPAPGQNPTSFHFLTPDLGEVMVVAGAQDPSAAIRPPPSRSSSSPSPAVFTKARSVHEVGSPFRFGRRRFFLSPRTGDTAWSVSSGGGSRSEAPLLGRAPGPSATRIANPPPKTAAGTPPQPG